MERIMKRFYGAQKYAEEGVYNWYVLNREMKNVTTT
jgi:hypothetical protein